MEPCEQAPIDPGDTESTLPLPAASVEASVDVSVAAVPVTPDAFRRAPTLMRGNRTGAQGNVRVWSPSLWRLWGLVLYWVLVLLAYLAACSIHEGLAKLAIAACLMIVGCWMSMASAVAELRRPSYLTTDDAGIGITMKKGCRALRWAEIRSVDRTDTAIILHAPDEVTIRLYGYRRAVREELFRFILVRARWRAEAGGQIAYSGSFATAPLPAPVTCKSPSEIPVASRASA